MPEFYVMTTTGSRPPKYVHSTMESATAEAKRLNEQLNCTVIILEVLGTVKTIEVPVTRKEQVVTLKQGTNPEEDDLPF